MSVKIARYMHDERIAWGVVHGNRIAPLRGVYHSTRQFIRHGLDEAWSTTAREAVLDLSDVVLLSPVTQDQQFVCQGTNYASHVRESGMDPSRIGFNTLFTKAASSLTSAHADVARPRHVRLLDYELELGMVMRRSLHEATSIAPNQLHEWLAGVTIVNDISARDVQLPQGQFYKGKSYRGFGPTGPFLVLLSPAEWIRWPELRMRLSVNGRVRQDAWCGDMIFKPHETLTELSGLHDLGPGDLIATGTPAGCAARAPSKLTLWLMKHVLSEQTKWKLFIKKGLVNPAYLQPGDLIQATIRTEDGHIDLGEQRNRIVVA